MTLSQLGDLSKEIDTLLESVEPIDSVLSLNTFTAARRVAGGFLVALAKSEKPEKPIDYHVRKEIDEDEEGYIESWDYHWGAGREEVVYGKGHRSRLHLSFLDPDDVYERREIKEDDLDSLNEFVESYRVAAVEETDSE